MNDYTRQTGVSTNVLHRPNASNRDKGAEGEGGAPRLLSQEFAELQVTASNFAARFIKDAPVRAQYIAQTRAYSQEILRLVNTGAITVQEGVQRTQLMRNSIMEAMRARTSDFGLALARFLKKEGKSLGELEDLYSKRFYGTDFKNLPESRQRAVWIEIIKKSGQPQKAASSYARVMGHAGKGLLALTVVISFYHIAVAEDKTRATAKEISVVGSSLAGSSALGAAGLLCGPAAIACVPLGIFVGGILGGMGAEYLFDELW